MSKNIIQSIVIIFAVLIVFAFLALIYGMYLKISKPTDILIKNPDFFSSNLSKDEKIMNIEASVVNLTSVAAFNGIGSNIAYSASKAGIVNLTK